RLRPGWDGSSRERRPRSCLLPGGEVVSFSVPRDRVGVSQTTRPAARAAMTRTPLLAVCLLGLFCATGSARERWSAEKAQGWGKATPWLVGANYTPATAINQLEMW